MSDNSGKPAEPRTGAAQMGPAPDVKAAADAKESADVNPAQSRSRALRAPGDPLSALDLRSGLADAECLLHYAAQAGIDIPAEILSALLTARGRIDEKPLDPQVIGAFLAAYAKLAAKLAPVTAETVRASNEQIGAVVQGSGALAILTTAVVVVLSLLLFVTNSISQDIADGIVKANDLAATARYHVGAPAIGNTADEKCGEATEKPNPPIELKPPLTEQDLIVELQKFAASIRDIQTSAVKLNFFVVRWEHNPLDPPDPAKPHVTPAGNPAEALQLPPSLSNFRAAALCKIAVYQYVRSFAQNVKADSVLVYGSLAAYVLPVLFALLGAFAFNLRDYTRRVKTRTYHPSYVNSARIIVAVIAGAIISLFNNFTQGMNLSPLAVAFLVGYGVEIFFTFLDSLLITFGAKKEVTAADAARRSG